MAVAALVPEQAWQAGVYQLIVDPELEDVSGNTIGAPFDAAPGTIGADHSDNRYYLTLQGRNHNGIAARRPMGRSMV
jgi:hypothetical protein